MKTFDILYKKAKTGATQSWQIFVDGDSFYTEAGQVGGVITKSVPTICEVKNEGRANATTVEEQAVAEAKAKHQKKLDTGYYTDINDIDKGTSYFEPMLAAKFSEEKDKIKWDEGVTVQPKLDGIRAIITADGATTRKGKKHMCIPHILEALKPLFVKDPNLILDGEVYNHEYHDDFNAICSLVRKTKPVFEDLILSQEFGQFHCYDCPQIGNLTQEDPFIERYNAMRELLGSVPGTCVHVVPNLGAKSESDVKLCHDEFVSQGYEGIIVRINSSPYQNKRSDYLLKYKIFDDDEFVIEDLEEGDGGASGMAAKIIIHTKDGVLCKPNIKATHKVKRSMWRHKKEYIGKTCTVRYFGVTKDGSLRFPYMVDIDRWLYE